MARKIIHVDMDAFFASVEQRDNPSLQSKAVIVGGQPGSRGVVAACSYEARKFGVHSAMPSSRAAKLCPEAIFVKPNFNAYKEASTLIHDVFKRYTAHIEPLSLDEAYLDVSEAAEKIGSATAVAIEIKKEIKEAVNLTASAGVSYNKFLAKIASDMDKPDGIYVIRPENAEAFIEQLEIRKFFGVGKVTEKKMHGLNIYTGADLKKLTKFELQASFGKSGNYYYNIARGIDDRPVKADRTRKSVGSETTFAENVLDKKQIWKTLQSLVTKVESTLVMKKMTARTLTLKVKYANFEQITRRKTLELVFVNKEEILQMLPELLHKTEVGHRPIRLIGVSVSSLEMLEIDSKDSVDSAPISSSTQLGLF